MTRSSRLAMWLLLLAAPLALLPFGACGGPDPVVPDAGRDGVTSDGNVVDAVVDAACQSPDYDGAIPEGWVADDSVSKCCPFFRPGSADAMPPPVEWEACPARIMGVLPNGAKCKSLKVNWNPPLLQPGASGQGFVDKDSGAVYLSTARVFDAGGYTLLHADPNGSVADAIYVPAKSPCGLAQVRQSLAATGWSFEVYDPSKFRSTGILAGTGLAMTSTLRVPLDGGQHEISSGGAGVLDMDPTGNLWLYDPAAPSMSPKLISSPSAGQGLEVVPNFFEDALTWVAEGAVSMKIRLYHAGKTVNFIDYSGIDPQHGAGCLGGDGKDMVWVEGFGLENGARYKQAAYYTSPYTTDPSKLQPRRLRSDSYRILDTVSTTVGCGYAARFESRSVRIIRLSDGVSWTLPPTELDASFADAVNWVTPFAITCSEVWVMTERLPVRIDIASLGPGDPPD